MARILWRKFTILLLIFPLFVITVLYHGGGEEVGSSRIPGSIDNSMTQPIPEILEESIDNESKPPAETTQMVKKSIDNESTPPKKSINKSLDQWDCEEFFDDLNMEVPSLLVDLKVLKDMEKGNCTIGKDQTITIALNSKHAFNYTVINPQLKIIFFHNDSSTDYLEFHSATRNVQIIPQNFANKLIGELVIPTDVWRFGEVWRRSHFIRCANLTMNRDSDKVYAPAKASVETLAKLRDELVEFKMFPHLMCGTLIGWYRECNVIPHTVDMDLGVMAHTFDPEYINYAKNKSSAFDMTRRMGAINESFELTLNPRDGIGRYTDLFLIYDTVINGTEVSTMGSMLADGTKYRFIYPRHNPYCAADLLGHIFWVSCNPDLILLTEVGDNWFINVQNYGWLGKNGKEHGRWTKEQMVELEVKM